MLTLLTMMVKWEGLDTRMYEHFNNIPRTEVSDYLFELKTYGLIEISPKDSGEEYGLVNITRKGL